MSAAMTEQQVEVRHALPLRHWHVVLARRLAAQGRSVRLAAVDERAEDSRDQRRAACWLLAVERRVYGARSAMFAATRLPPAAVRPGESPAVTIVLAGEPPAEGRIVRPRFDGRLGENALLAALLAGRAPLINVQECAADSPVELVVGQPAIEDRHVFSRALDDVLPRLVTLLAQAVEHLDRPPPALSGRPAPPGSAGEPAMRSAFGSALELLAGGIAERLRWRLRAARGRQCGWRVAFRIDHAASTAAGRTWSSTGSYLPLPCPADRYYADPFPFEHEGRRYVFFEEFPWATRRGAIARVEVDNAGRPGAPRTVLDLPVHLSYPLLLRHGDAVYMLPEMSAARRLQLFRADPFPDRWVSDRVLLDDTAVADATPVFHDGLWWLFATQTDDGGSSWDQLALFHAPDLFGPWTPHPANPVLIDAGASRPAGAMWHEDGVLMRVAQDCRGGYGRGLAICRVDRLDREGYAQTVVARLGVPPGSAAAGVHTLNRDGRLEAIDLAYD